MTNQILSELGNLLTEARSLLQRIEPHAFENLPFLLRLALYWGIARSTCEVLGDSLKGIIRALHAATIGTLDFIAPHLPLDFAEPLALFLVKFEATIHRTRLARSRKALVLALPRRRNLSTHPTLSPQPITRRSNFFRFFAMAPLVIMGGALATVVAAIRNLVKLTPINLISWLAALWYLDLLRKPVELASSTHLGDIKLSTLLAVGTLLAAICSVINSDVRGRAELNKTASLACRTTLHGCTYPLMTAANALHEIRNHFARTLQRFPRRHEVRRIAQGFDLEWRGRLLLPRGAFPISHTWRSSKVLRPRLIRRFITEWVYVRRPLRQPGDRMTTISDVKTYYSALESAQGAIIEKISNLRDSGMIGKVDRVLDRSGINILAIAHDDGFGKVEADALLAAGNLGWVDVTISIKDKEDLLDSWRSFRKVELDDPGLRRACVDLTHELRRFIRIGHRRHWHAAVAEQRLIHLAESIDRSLRPQIFERMRQHFGK